MCHTAARTRPVTTTRRQNVPVVRTPRSQNNTRTVRGYATPASIKEPIKYGPPLSPKLREQTVSATSNMMPSMYSLDEGVRFTALPCEGEGCVSASIFCGSEDEIQSSPCRGKVGENPAANLNDLVWSSSNS